MTFPSQSLTGGRRAGKAASMKPASATPNTLKSLQKTSRDFTVSPPKRRRQLTDQPPKQGNPFAGLNNLVGKALKG